MSNITTDKSSYWKRNVAIIVKLLSIWALFSFGAGIVFSKFLDSIDFFGVPLGFWFANQGSIYIFLAIIVIYAHAMNKLDKEFNVDED